MIKIINKLVLKNPDGKILETSTRNLKSEKYKNCTIIDYKYILEISDDGISVNEINFPSSKERTSFLKALNDYFVCENTYENNSFNSDDFPIIEIEFEADYLFDFSGG